MTANLRYPAPAAETRAALQQGQMDLHAHIDAICKRSEQVDPLVQALLPEPARRSRLHREADALLDWAHRLCGLEALPSGRALAKKAIYRCEAGDTIVSGNRRLVEPTHKSGFSVPRHPPAF